MASTTLALVLLVGVPLAWHLAMAAYVFWDAGRRGMAWRKWTLVALLVPLFGFFAYLFERDERDYDPEEDPYAGGGWRLEGERDDGDAGTEGENER